jgi:hypothetical protein
MGTVDFNVFDADNRYYEAGQAQASGAGLVARGVVGRDGAPEAGAA